MMNAIRPHPICACAVAKSLPMATPKGGYDCDFINDPPKSLECTICLLTLREPHVISCCGNHFCRPCVERVQRDRKPCPLCNDPNFTVLLHKGVMREINALLVRCPQKELGCGWEGELGQLQRHLDPGAGLNERGCGFVEVGCVYECGGRFLRGEIHGHELEMCPRRPVEVVMASIVKRLDALTVENQEIKAENQQLKREVVQLKDSLATKAEVTQLKNGLATKAEVTQLKDGLVTKAEVTQLKDGLALSKAEVTQLKDGLALSKAEVTRLSDATAKELKLCAKTRDVDAKYLSLEERIPVTSTPPVNFSMLNYDHFKSVDYVWNSEPFYSHHGGYKMRVQLYPGGLAIGDGTGTHLAVYVFIMHGENDDKLQWPFRGSVTVQAYNRGTETWDRTDVVRFAEAVNHDCCGKPRADCISNSGWGIPGFIANNDILCYAGGGVIRFRVYKVDLQ